MTQTWQQRRARAAKLAGRHAPARDLLDFYGRLLEQQETVGRAAGRWLTDLHDPIADAPVDLAQVLAAPQRTAFRRFVRDTGKLATPLLAELASRLLDSTETRDILLDRFARRASLDEVASQLDCDPVALEFFPRAFLQPVAEAAVGRRRGDEGASSESAASANCPWCGRRPQLALLVDEAEVRGRRRLVCSLCSGEWSFPRSTCPSCGETAADKLPHHLSESWSHVRVEECASCTTYIKAIDLRIDGLAVPVVDEIASVELDLWAAERGLEKIQRNLLGL